MAASATATLGPVWATFFGSGEFPHIRKPFNRLRSMSEQDRDDGKMAEIAREWGPRMAMSAASALFAVGIFYGISTEKWDKFEKADMRLAQLIRQNNEGMLENRDNITKAVAGLKISFGMARSRIEKAVAVLTEAQRRAETASEKRAIRIEAALERLRYQRNTP